MDLEPSPLQAGISKQNFKEVGEYSIGNCIQTLPVIFILVQSGNVVVGDTNFVEIKKFIPMYMSILCKMSLLL